VEKRITAADANRNFSKLLRGIRDGKSYLVTSNGRLVARITPARECRTKRAARAALLKRLRSEPAVQIGRTMRDELYDGKP